MGTSPGTSPAAPANGPVPDGGVSVTEAAAALGVSPNTIRRWVKQGTLRAERVPRPQGYSVRIHLPEQVPTSATSREVPALAPDQARAAAMAEYNTKLLEPLAAIIRDQELVIRGQAERIGRLEARLEALEGQQVGQDIAPAEEGPPEAATGLWGRFLRWLYVGA